MIKISHYEVYTDNGSGWQLIDRFTAENRQDAFNLAKEKEAEKNRVKIIKEIFDVQDNSYQESVEYVSNLGGNKKTSQKKKVGEHDIDNDIVEFPEVKTIISRTSLLGVIIKLILLISVSLIFANLFVNLLFPLLEIVVPEESSRPVLFGVFFIVFLAMSIPLLLKSIPWYIFIGNKTHQQPIKEKKFYIKAENLIRAYNLNSDKDPIVATAYPEAPLEYKQYIVSFLGEIISHVQSPLAMQSRFSRFGIKLMVYGGCLELARYCGLTMPEANSVMYDAIKIIDGKSADLEGFYEGKRSYRDNDVAVFLTGVGAHLMAQVINGLPISEKLLNFAFNRWVSQDKNPEFDRHPTLVATEKEESKAVQKNVTQPANTGKPVLVSVKSDLKFMDSSANQDKIATNVSEQIRNILRNLQNKYQGTDVIEAEGITSVKFNKIDNAIKYAIACLKDINIYQEEVANENLLMRNCCAITLFRSDEEPNLSGYLTDMFEHIYSGEIVITSDVQAELNSNEFKTDFLGEKAFKSLNINQSLYKLLD